MEIKVQVKEIKRVSPIQFEVWLEEVSGERAFAIYIGLAEAILLAQEVQTREMGMPSPRPMTYDLYINLAQRLGWTITKVVVSGIKDNIFYANIHLQKGEDEMVEDARPSNAIALAIAAGVDLFVEESVFDNASTTKKKDDNVISLRDKGGCSGCGDEEGGDKGG